MKLYELSTKYQQLVDIMDSADEETQETLLDTLESIQDAIEIKADNIARILNDFDLEKAMIDAEIKRLKDRSDRVAKQNEQLKKYLLSSFQTAEMKKLKTNLFTFNVRSSESVEIMDESQIPSNYMVEKTVKNPDKIAIKEAIKNNQIVAGCTIKTKESLVIK